MDKGHDKGHKGQMSDREAMKLALEALNRSDYLGWQLNIPIIKALRERLAQPEQKPFCYHDGRNIVGKEYADHSDVFPLYTAPPKQEPDAYGDGNVYRGQRSKDSETKTLHYTEPPRNSWFKLTDAEVWDEWVRAVDESNRSNRELAFRFARAIETKLKEKNT